MLYFLALPFIETLLKNFTFTLPNGMKGSGNRLIDYNATNEEGKINFISNSAGIKEKEHTMSSDEFC